MEIPRGLDGADAASFTVVVTPLVTIIIYIYIYICNLRVPYNYELDFGLGYDGPSS